MTEGQEPDQIRISDADRDLAAERLRDAAIEGRIGMDELDERLDVVLKARTFTDLEPVTRDLPAAYRSAPPEPSSQAPGSSAARWAERVGGRPTGRRAIAVMGGFHRRGRWTIARRFTTFAFWGGGKIDLREARFEERETRLRCFAVMGGTQVVVPPGLDVEVHGIGLMGGFGGHGEPGDPGAPRLVVSGLAFWGGVQVTYDEVAS